MTGSYLWYLSRFSYNIPALWQSYKISIEVLLSQGQVYAIAMTWASTVPKFTFGSLLPIVKDP